MNEPDGRHSTIQEGKMGKINLVRTAGLALVGLVALASIAAAGPAASARANTEDGKTLTFDVHFSPFALVPSNASPDPNTGLRLGDQLVFHDQLFMKGRRVGDEGGSCVIVDAGQGLANCTETIQLSGGTITAQFLNSAPALKHLAITGGSGTYRRAAGDATLLEHGDGTGTETLHLFGLGS
jgi:hypothetical protein